MWRSVRWKTNLPLVKHLVIVNTRQTENTYCANLSMCNFILFMLFLSNYDEKENGTSRKKRMEKKQQKMCSFVLYIVLCMFIYMY